MNGYRDRVRRHRQALAESQRRGERAAIPRFNWVEAAVEGVAEAAACGWRSRHADEAGHAGPTERDKT